MSRKLLLLGVISFLIGCQEESVLLGRAIVDERLLTAYSKFDQTKQLIRPVLSFENGQYADNCESYWKLLASYHLLETQENQLIKNEYLICDSLFVLSEFDLFTDEVNIRDKGLILKTRLDLRTFPSSLKQQVTEDLFTLARLFPNDTKVSENEVTYDASDWSYSLRVVAVLNANGNSDQDWLIQLADEAKEGNYRNYSTYIIYDVSKEILSASGYFHKPVETK